jgi:hypothetical protein
MPFAPIFALTVLIAGACALPVVASTPRLRSWARFIVPMSAGLSLSGVVATLLEEIGPVIVSRWRPTAFFGAALAFTADPMLWALALAAVCAVAGSALVQLSRRAQPRTLAGLFPLGVLMAVLGSLWADNLLTVLVFWGGFDLVWMLGMAASGASVQRVAFGGGLGALSLLILWAGAVLTEAGGGGLLWHLLAPTEFGLGLLVVAGVLRLGIYPFHMGLPLNLPMGIPWMTSLLLGPILGWGLLLRLAIVEGGTLPGASWLPSLAMVSFAVGGVLAWTRRRSRELVPLVGMAAAGGILWGAALAGEQAPLVLVGGGASWTLGLSLIYLDRCLGKSYVWRIGSILGGLALLGGPLTLSMVVSSLLVVGSLLSTTEMLVYVVGQGLLTAALAGQLLKPVPGAGGARVLDLAVRAAGVAVLALPILLGGVQPSLLLRGLQVPSLVEFAVGRGALGWALWLVAVGAGLALFWLERYFRQRVQPILGLIHDLVSLNWLFGLFLGGLERVSQFLRETAELMEGAGAVLWAMSVFILLLLVVVGP